jgi:hypothetical protein
MSTYFYEILLGKQTKKYTENPMTPKAPDEPIDDTYIVVKNVVDKLSELIIQPYDYVKKYIIKKNENDKNENENDFEEELSVVTISYDTIYKEDQTEQTDANLDTFVKTAATAYTFVVSTYNDAVT